MEDENDELEKAIDEKDWNKANIIVNKMWIQYQVMMAKIVDPNLKELTFLKTPVETLNGKYLLLFIHVDGQKIQLQGNQNVE